MSKFINWECGGEGRNSDSDFEDDGWRPRSRRIRGAARRGGGVNSSGRGGESRYFLSSSSSSSSSDCFREKLSPPILSKQIKYYPQVLLIVTGTVAIFKLKMSARECCHREG